MIGQDFNSITGVVKYTPDGTGHYIKGTLVAAVTSFPGGTFNAASPKSDFCNYTLDTALSGYTINLNGTGTETLTWDSVAGNAAACPEEPSFNDQTAIAINGSDSRVEITSANFLNQNVAATGNCTP